LISTELTEESTRRIIRTAEGDVQINEAGSGYPIFMLHGTGPGASGWSNFAPNITGLSDKYRVIALTFPGWGLSAVTDLAKPQRKTQAHVIKLVMDELNIEKAALVGNSMGGMATQQFAVDYPERMSHFITMGASVGGTNYMAPGGPTEGIRTIFETYRNPTPENFRRLVTTMVYDSSFVTDELCELRSRVALENKTHLEHWLKRMSGGPQHLEDLTPALAKVNIPAFVIHGRDDRVVSLESSLRLNAVMPNVRMLVFNHCGHWAQIEHAKEFNAVVDTFITLNS
jgi:2-hydroxy-6-oxonona-2,4-dienedioate hydrolase